MELFSQRARTETSSRLRGEGPLEFIDRSAQPWAGPVRDLWARLFGEYPDGPARETMRKRLWSRDEVEARSAGFELLVHGVLRRLGYEIGVEEPAPGVTGRPDFAARREPELFFVEASVVQPGTQARAERAAFDELRDLLDRLPQRQCWLAVTVRSFGAVGTGASHAVARTVKEWMAAFEDCTRSDPGPSAKVASREFCLDGWDVTIDVYRRRSMGRGRDDRRLVSISSIEGALADHKERVRGKVREKAEKYREIQAPLVVAVNHLDVGLDGTDIMDALFGDELTRLFMTESGLAAQDAGRRGNGAWYRAEHLCDRHVSATLLFADAGFTNIAQISPLLVHHPAAKRPLDCDAWPLGQWVPDQSAGTFRTREGIGLGSLLGLPHRWPDVTQRVVATSAEEP